MTIWLNAQLPPAIAAWITATFGITTIAVRDLGLRGAEDREIFEAAKAQRVVVMTKDRDFVDLVERYSSLSQVIWRLVAIRLIHDSKKSSLPLCQMLSNYCARAKGL